MNLNQTIYRLFCAIIVTLVAVFGLNPSAYADTFYVDGSSGSDTNDGSTWSNAFKTVQKALDEASIGAPHEIWVVAGIYYPDEIDGQDSDDREDTFSLVDGVKLYGGFDGTEVFLVDRDPENNITILSGDIDQDGQPDSNSYNVLRAFQVGPTTVLNGFTVTAGNGDGLMFPYNSAGAMLIDSSSPVVVRCRFVENLGGGTGAIYWPGGLMQGNPAAAVPAFMVNCEFIDNQTTGEDHREEKVSG